MSCETDQAETGLEQISLLLDAKAVENKSSHVFDFCNHDPECSCEFCSDVFLVKTYFQFTILRQKFAFFSSKKTTGFCNVTTAQGALECAVEKARNAINDLRSVLSLGASKRKTAAGKRVADVSKIIYHLTPDEIGRLLYGEETIGLECLKTNSMLASDRDTISASATLAALRNQVEGLEHRSLIFHNYRRAVAMLYHESIAIGLGCKEGIDVVELNWRLDKHLVAESGALEAVSAASSADPQWDASHPRTKAGRARNGSSKRPAAKGRRSKKSVKESKNETASEQEVESSGIARECAAGDP